MIRSAVAAAALVACRHPAAPSAPAALVLHVAPGGNDASSDGPFATLEGARDAIRRLKRMPAGGVVVEISAGRYAMRGPLQLEAQDSGRAGAPVIYRARPGAIVELDGGREVRGLAPVTDPAILDRLAPEARAHVMSAPLGELDPGSPAGGGIDVFFDHQPLTLARWPDTDDVTIPGVVGDSPIDVRGTRGDRRGVLAYEGERPARWLHEPDPWVHGFWFWDWADGRQPIAAIDPARHTLTLGPPAHAYGYRAGQWYYAYNLLSELDRPGEWYVDRTAKVLYVWPPGHGRLDVSVAHGLLSIDHVHDLIIEGLVVENTRDTAIVMRDSEHVTLRGLTVRDAGGWGVTIEGGHDDAVEHSEIVDTGDGGLLLAGGDRRSLQSAHHRAVADHVHRVARWHRTGNPAIEVRGVGQTVAQCRIDDVPHVAVSFFGNDHVIDHNLIENACTETNDAGAIAAGRDWTMRGTSITGNIIHGARGFCGHGCNGVMLDDLFSGTRIAGNIFDDVTRGVLVGGGRDNVIVANVFSDVDAGVVIDARGLGWAAYSVAESMRPALDAVPYREPPWSTRYPELASILDDEPAAPKRNTLAGNIADGVLDTIDPAVRAMQRIGTNIGTGAR